MNLVNYKELEFYNKGYEFTIEIYKVTKEFPKEEMYGIISQLRRASLSIISNIAEGSGRSSTKDFKNFLHNSLGSAREIEVQLSVAKDLEYLQVSTYDRLSKLLNEVIGKMIRYMQSLN